VKTFSTWQSAQSTDIAFVPTMGALHDGHLALISQARQLSPHVVVSIFVNPLQFDNPDDLARYPRDLEGDIAKAESAGASEIWAPTYDEVYPGEIERISSGEVGKTFEGASRAGHFDGMLTVVNQLFKTVQPRYAIFGEKDFQQLYIVQTWVRKSGIPVEIVPAPIVRESDGLAMSSRNIRLSPTDRQAALVISKALRSGSKERALEILQSEPAFTLDYFEIIDPATFTIAHEPVPGSRAIVAGWINGVRLLDNMPMEVRV
jgi:pantoate--beta-alanine ligase